MFKFFEHGSPEQRKELANQLTGQILPLSLQMYGCRVIQKVYSSYPFKFMKSIINKYDKSIATLFTGYE